MQREALDLRTGQPASVECAGDYDDTQTATTIDSQAVFRRHLMRISPSTPAYLCDSRPGDWGGFYSHDHRHIIVHAGDGDISRLKPGNRRILFHELWHYAEFNILSEADCELVYCHLRERGDSFPCPSGYYDLDIERAARAFDSYASARAEGLEMTRAKKGTAQAVFERVYEGVEHAQYLGRARAEQRQKRIAMAWKVAELGYVPALFVGLFGVLLYLG